MRSFKRLRGDDAAPGSHSAYRITVRQLEALVRLSEAIARVHLSTTVTAEHVAEVSGCGCGSREGEGPVVCANSLWCREAGGCLGRGRVLPPSCSRLFARKHQLDALSPTHHTCS